MGKYAVKIVDYKISICEQISKKENPVGYAVLSEYPAFVYFNESNQICLYLVRAKSHIEAKIKTQEFLEKSEKHTQAIVYGN